MLFNFLKCAKDSPPNIVDLVDVSSVLLKSDSFSIVCLFGSIGDISDVTVAVDIILVDCSHLFDASVVLFS